MSDFEPEIGQMCFGNPTGEFAMSDIGEAAFFHAYRAFCRVFGNIHQKQWVDHWPGCPGETIGGVTCRKYYWGDDEASAVLPNFEAFGVEIRWYKHPGRSMSANKDLAPDQWAAWLSKTIVAIERADQEDRDNGENEDD